MHEFRLDTELLELQHSLRSFLEEHDVVWFQDYERIEVDLSNAELKIDLIGGPEALKLPLREFAKRHGFKKIFYSREKGAIYLRRRASKRRRDNY